MHFFDWLFKKEIRQKSGWRVFSNRVGIALSGGGARGYAHIGVLKALLEHGITPEIVSGTSMGSLVGLLYSSGFTPDEIQNIMNKEPIVKMLGMAFWKHGFFEMKGLKKILEQFVAINDFSSLKKPLYISVTNLNTGTKEVKSIGPLIEYVLASCSVPVVFAPIEINGNTYIDGGMFDNLPADSIRKKCQFLIGVNVNPVGEVKTFNGIRDIAERSFTLGIDQNVRVSKMHCDFVIEPSAIIDFTFWDFDKVDEIVEVGYQHTKYLLTKGKLKIPFLAKP